VALQNPVFNVLVDTAGKHPLVNYILAIISFYKNVSKPGKLILYIVAVCYEKNRAALRVFYQKAERLLCVVLNIERVNRELSNLKNFVRLHCFNSVPGSNYAGARPFAAIDIYSGRDKVANGARVVSVLVGEQSSGNPGKVKLECLLNYRKANSTLNNKRGVLSLEKITVAGRVAI